MKLKMDEEKVSGFILFQVSGFRFQVSSRLARFQKINPTGLEHVGFILLLAFLFKRVVFQMLFLQHLANRLRHNKYISIYLKS
jgi:hypothetical protein